MIWGEIINSLRSIHLSLTQEFEIDPKCFLEDVDFKNLAPFPFPKEIDDFDEWNELIPSPALEDLLPHHPVERVLLEGPILPIQKIEFYSKKEITNLFQSILACELLWAGQLNLLTPEMKKYLERACSASALRCASRLGYPPVELN